MCCRCISGGTGRVVESSPAVTKHCVGLFVCRTFRCTHLSSISDLIAYTSIPHLFRFNG